MNGILVQLYRTGVHGCIDSGWWEFMVTNQFICTPQQAKDGARYYLGDNQSHQHGDEMKEMNISVSPTFVIPATSARLVAVAEPGCIQLGAKLHMWVVRNHLHTILRLQLPQLL